MKKVIGALLMLALVWVLPAQAVKTKSIYEAEVPVSSQDAKLRDQAIQQAFVQTLMKMSGSNQILQNPSIRAVLANAGNEVDEFSYLPSQENGLPYILKVRFDAKAMKKILTEAKEPVWGENRSLILLWLTMETPGHAPEILDNQSNQEFAQFIKKEALKRGLPAMLPMMDISELDVVSAADIRAKTVGPLQKAAARYHSDGILIGSIDLQNKKWNGHWKLVLGPDQWDWELSADTASDLASLICDKLVSTLAGRYASVQTEEESAEITLIVKGVAEQEDFEDMMRFIKHLSLIEELEVENVSGDEVIMHLNLQGTQAAFIKEASVGQHLQLQLEQNKELTYLWIR